MMRKWILLLASVFWGHVVFGQTVREISSQDAHSLLSDLDKGSSVIIDGRAPELVIFKMIYNFYHHVYVKR